VHSFTAPYCSIFSITFLNSALTTCTVTFPLTKREALSLSLFLSWLSVDLRLPLKVMLVNAQGLDEPGIDGGGLFREFLSELLKTGFDPNRGYFTSTQDGQLYPNPQVRITTPSLCMSENGVSCAFALCCRLPS
jgi:hypothetical protein